MYYAVFPFQRAGLSATSSSLLANGLQGVVLNLFTYPNMYYMDKWGRRRPMIRGGIGMGISMMVIGVLMKTTGWWYKTAMRLGSGHEKLTCQLCLGNPVYDNLTKKTNFTSHRRLPRTR